MHVHRPLCRLIIAVVVVTTIASLTRAQEATGLTRYRVSAVVSEIFNTSPPPPIGPLVLGDRLDMEFLVDASGGVSGVGGQSYLEVVLAYRLRTPNGTSTAFVTSSSFVNNNAPFGGGDSFSINVTTPELALASISFRGDGLTSSTAFPLAFGIPLDEMQHARISLMEVVAVDFTRATIDEVQIEHVGACCLGDACFYDERFGCESAGGVFQGLDSRCETACGAPCAAEVTGDVPPDINVFDLLSYLDLWFAGCP